MTMILCYHSLSSANPGIKPSDYEFTSWMEGWKPKSSLMPNLFLSLETQVLYAHEVENLPFIWFYMCADDERMLDNLLNRLWQLTITPLKTPNDWRKSHNAVSFMGGLLARAKFVNVKLVHFWLKEMIEWCVDYIRNARHVDSGGGAQHCTFYAIVQAAFFLLCFRYKELNEMEAAVEIRLWGVGRIVHSHLEPLNFISKPLAMFFASISRYMQIVYCSHIVDMNSEGNCVESCFPFLRFGLPTCGAYVQPLLRIFEPMDNDLSTINSIQSKQKTEVADDSDDYDFMDEDDGLGLDYDSVIVD